MAALENIFNHARRHCTWRPPAPISTLILRTFYSSHSSLTFESGLRDPHLITSPSSCSTLRSPFVGFYRSFSSSEDPPETPAATSKQTVPIKPVSYTVKPKDPPSPSSTPGEEELSERPTTSEFQRKRETVRTATFRTRETDSEEVANAEPRPWTREDIRYVKDIRPISPVSYPSRVAPLPEDKVSAQAEEDVDEGSRRENEQLERERKKIETDARIRRVLRAEEEKVLPFPTLIKVEKKKPKVVLELQEAIREIKANAKRNFDETVEAHVNLGVDPRRGDQMVRGATTLPHGTGKIVRVAVFAEGAAADEARAAGADIVGGDELIEEIRKGGAKLSFDKCISTPMFMPRLGKIAKILGPRGLMPNPKLGSVTTDVTGAVRGAKHGRIDFKIDKTAIVHVGLGKVSFSEESIRENVGAFMNALLLAKPVGLKKTSKYAGYVNSFTLCSTMGPGFPISIQSLSIAADHHNRLQLK